MGKRSESTKKPISKTAKDASDTDEPPSAEEGTSTDRPLNAKESTSTDKPLNAKEGTSIDKSLNAKKGTSIDKSLNAKKGTSTDELPSAKEGTSTDKPLTAKEGTSSDKSLNAKGGSFSDDPTSAREGPFFGNASSVDEVSISGVLPSARSSSIQAMIMDEEYKEPPKKSRRNTVSFVRDLVKELRLNSIHVQKRVVVTSDLERIKAKTTKLSENMAAAFLVGAILGGFAFDLPYALKKSGFMGVFLLILCGTNSLYSGMLLGWCWNIMEERWPEYKGDFRSPYAEIGFKVGGRWLKYTVAVLVCINQYALSIIFLLLMAKLIDRASSSTLHFCPSIIGCACLLIPLTFFPRPKDFKFLGVAALVTVCVSVFLLAVAVTVDISHVNKITYTIPTFEGISVSFGIMILTFNTGAIYPTIQIDMYDRRKFPNSVFTAYLVSLFLIVTFPVLGYATYGRTTNFDVLNNIVKNKNLIGFARWAQVFFIIQTGCTIVIQMNPVFQLFEGLTKIPKGFTFKRIIIRFFMMIVGMLLALASKHLVFFILYVQTMVMNILSFLMPCGFYMVLVLRKDRENTNERKITKKEWFFLVELLIFGVAGIAASYMMARHQLIIKKKLQSNCYTLDQFYKLNYTSQYQF